MKYLGFVLDENLSRKAHVKYLIASSSDIALQILKRVLLETCRDKHVCKLVKKCLANNVPKFLCNHFTFNRDYVPRITRQSNCPRIPQVRTETDFVRFYTDFDFDLHNLRTYCLVSRQVFKIQDFYYKFAKEYF